MKKKLLTIIVLFSFIQLSAKKIDGKIIFVNDTLKVVFDIPFKLLEQEPNFSAVQHEVKFFDANGKKKKLKPTEAKEIQFNYQNQEIRMISVNNAKTICRTANIFLKVEMLGDKINLYKIYSMETQNMGGTMSSYFVEEYVFQKKDNILKTPSRFSFKKDMVQYFSDCPELSMKIEKKELGRNEIEQIYKFYNSTCK